MDKNKRSWWPWGWSHRDTVWLLILVVVTGILTLASLLSGRTEIVGYFSFASTILSIILAVIAILHTMIQGSEHNQATSSMRDKIEEFSTQARLLLQPIIPGEQLLKPSVTSPPDSPTPRPSAPELEDRPPQPSRAHGQPMHEALVREVLFDILRTALQRFPHGGTPRMSRNELIGSAVQSQLPLDRVDQVIQQLINMGDLAQQQHGRNVDLIIMDPLIEKLLRASKKPVHG